MQLFEMSRSVSHVNVPEEFTFSVKIQLNVLASLLISIQQCYPTNDVMVINCLEVAIPATGLYVWDDVECWAYNQHKHGFMTLYFKSMDAYRLLQTNLQLKKKLKENSISHKLFRYVPSNGWVHTESYSTFDDSHLIGYTHYLRTIEQDLDNHQKHQPLLKSIGEFKSLSYLLYGVPGTGKTTLIKTLSSKYNMDVYVVNAIHAKSSNIGNILNPCKNTSKPVILLFEDFDRFLASKDASELMSLILNAMDGFDDSGNTIRFFTGNNCNSIFQHTAIINRISGKFKFGYPSYDMFKAKLVKLLDATYTSADDAKIDSFISLIVDKNDADANARGFKTTLRPFTSHCLRYLFNEHCIDDMIQNIDQLLKCK